MSTSAGCERIDLSRKTRPLAFTKRGDVPLPLRRLARGVLARLNAWTGPALEQSLLFENGGAEERIAPIQPLGGGRKMKRHQADWFGQLRIGPRRAQHLVIESALIKRLMLDPHGRQKIVGMKIFGRQHARPQRRVGQTAMKAGKLLVGDEARGIDEDPAGVEKRLQNIGKDVERPKIPVFL